MIMNKRILGAVLLCASMTAEADLASRLAGQVSFDALLNVTWLNDANLASKNTFGVSGIAADGRMDHATATNWISAMNTSFYLGYNDWQLPSTQPINNSTYNTAFQFDGSSDAGFNLSAQGSIFSGATGSQMAHLYYTSQLNTGVFDINGTPIDCFGPVFCLTSASPFSFLQGYYY